MNEQERLNTPQIQRESQFEEKYVSVPIIEQAIPQKVG